MDPDFHLGKGAWGAQSHPTLIGNSFLICDFYGNSEISGRRLEPPSLLISTGDGKISEPLPMGVESGEGAGDEPPPTGEPGNSPSQFWN